jgi:uncharacterized protein YbaR (Trm112 family)
VIEGLWTKDRGDGNAISTGPQVGENWWHAFLICPECLAAGRGEVAILHDPANDQFVCEACGEKYPVVGGIPLLMRRQVREALYKI